MKNKRTYSIHCPYCGAPVVCRPASTVYGTDTIDPKSYLYLCSNWPSCDAYVSAHKKDRRPMGTLANSELRHKRILAHRALQRLQKERHMDKWAAYLWLRPGSGLMQTTPTSAYSPARCATRSSPCAGHLPAQTENWQHECEVITYEEENPFNS